MSKFTMMVEPDGNKSRHEESQRVSSHVARAQTCARTAGVLLLISLIAGGFGEVYVPTRLIVSWDATATAHNLRAHEFLFRLSFAGYLLESICDVALSLLFYILLRPVGRGLALLAAFLGLIGTAVFAVSEFFYIAPLILLGGANDLKTFTPEQLNTLALLSLKLSTFGGMMFTVFYGLAWLVRGYLIFRSGYLPRFLGILMTIGGMGFIVRNFLLVLSPSHASGILLLLMLPGGLSLPVWLLFQRVNAGMWEASESVDRTTV